MPPQTAEDKIRAQLPVIRFMQSSLPLPLAQWLNRQGTALVRLPEDVSRAAVSADGVACDWLIPHGCREDQVLLYLHGGGFVYGQTPLHMQMVAYLARSMGLRALLVDYRLAPRHPFPAALDDCFAAYRWLLQQGISASSIALAGDSAGGNLTITTLMKLRDGGLPLPAAAACLSPVTDMSSKGSFSHGRPDPLLSPQAVKLYNRSYLAQHDPRDPLISPVFGDWRGLPPLLIHVGEDEILRADAQRAADLARAAGVEARLEIYPRMWHVWQLFLSLPQAAQSLDDIAGFLKSHLGAPVR